ncbi:hypothetical protein AB6A40_005913 [Gnathostoma spinigerum]|uniref:Uncharacterized protein n=1 Tax=Gnathostoma spinigerum TaxID=75299 RepID=A0ABD6EPH1_9BILA
MLRRDPRRVLQVPIIPLEIIDDCWKEPETFMDRLRARCYISSNRYRRVLIEFLCTAIFVYGGLSSGAQRAISNFSSHDWLGMCIGWGISLALSIQLASNISGGHLNPAISLHFLSMGRLCIYDFLLYTVAQICGAYVGSALMYVTYYDGLHALMDTKMDDIVMMKLFAPYPAPNTTIIGGLLDQIMGTAYFSICLSSITDVRNGVPSFLQPTFIGLNLMLIGIFAGYHFGFAINPARDLGSRLFALSIGFGRRTFLFVQFYLFHLK